MWADILYNFRVFFFQWIKKSCIWLNWSNSSIRIAISFEPRPPLSFVNRWEYELTILRKMNGNFYLLKHKILCFPRIQNIHNPYLYWNGEKIEWFKNALNNGNVLSKTNSREFEENYNWYELICLFNAWCYLGISPINPSHYYFDFS